MDIKRDKIPSPQTTGNTWIELKRLTVIPSSRQGIRVRRAKGRSATCSCWKLATLVRLRLREILHKPLIGRTRGEITAAPYEQGLIDRFFEAKMRLLDIAILMGNARVIPGGLH